MSECYVVWAFMVQQQSDLGAVRAWWGREQVRGTIITQSRRAVRVGRQRKRDRRVLVVGVETQPLPSVMHVICESSAVGARGTGGAVAVVRTRVQLIQGDGADSRAVHGEGVTGIAGKVRERVRSRRRAHVHLRTILLTAVILQRVVQEETGTEIRKHYLTVLIKEYFDIVGIKFICFFAINNTTLMSVCWYRA